MPNFAGLPAETTSDPNVSAVGSIRDIKQLAAVDLKEIGGVWIGSKAFAQLAGLSSDSAGRILREASSGKKAWRDAILEVRTVKSSGRGGLRYEVRLNSLPNALQTKALLKCTPAAKETATTTIDRDTLWARFERLPGRSKDDARARLDALHAVHRLVGSGVKKCDVYEAVANQIGQSVATLRGWLKLVQGVGRSDWLPTLAPKWRGRTATAECSPEAWDFFKADFLRLEEPAAEACYERLQHTASHHGWTVPSVDTLIRRVEREFSPQVLCLARKGTEALKRLYPSQERDRSVFHALQAVNADGHKFDVFVKWPDGEVVRPCMVAWQDLCSGKILAHRVDKTENTDSVRLSFGDLVERYGIPEHAYLDNGRAFASKWMTGGAVTRYRFKIKPEDPAGILTVLGVEPHWVTPYSGQSKPIERAWRELCCERVAKHTAFEGAYTGNKPDAKPENYGSRAIPLEKFLAILDQEIVAHNARAGRRGGVCAGRSFDEVFTESYSKSIIRRATAEQRRLWLLAAEGVRAHSETGEIVLETDRRNRYWCEALARHAGDRLVARFDPLRLHDRIYVYTLAGDFIGEAECIQRAGFNDKRMAREHSRARNQFKRATREQLTAERRMSAVEAASLIPQHAEPQAPQPPKVTRMVTPNKVGGGRADAGAEADKTRDENFSRTVNGWLEEQRRESVWK